MGREMLKPHALTIFKSPSFHPPSFFSFLSFLAHLRAVVGWHLLDKPEVGSQGDL